MQIKVNGKVVSIQPCLTVDRLLAELNIPNKNLAIEYNGFLMIGEDMALQVIQADDIIEIVRLVGGG